MSLTCQVEIILNNISKKKAETVKKALEPDNVDFPQGLSYFIKRINEEYNDKIPIYITENGMANNDKLNSKREVDELKKIFSF